LTIFVPKLAAPQQQCSWAISL